MRVGDRSRPNRFIAKVAIHQQVIGAAMPFGAGDAQPGGGIALRVHVDEQDRHASDRKGSREVDRRRGLADAAFLVRHSQDEWFGNDSPRMVMKGQSRNPAGHNLFHRKSERAVRAKWRIRRVGGLYSLQNAD